MTKLHDQVVQQIEEALAVLGDSLGLFHEHVHAKLSPQDLQLWQSVKGAYEQCQNAAVMVACDDGVVGSTSEGPHHFDIVILIQKIFASHDMLFLQRQLRYNVSTVADLPKVFANSDQILQVLTTLVGNAIQHATRGSVIDIRVKEVNLRQGNGVEVAIVNQCGSFTERDRYRIFEKFYQKEEGGAHKAAGVGLALCREILQKSQGQLWVDIPEKSKVAFTFVLPCTEVVRSLDTSESQIYKYDISISNFSQLQHDLGHDKIHNIMNRIEDAVRQLVRYPIDVVAAFEQSGMVSTIYETQKGKADSVATRISKRLGSEDFVLGKDSIKLQLHYQLSVLK